MSLSNLAHSSRGATPILSVLRVPGWILMGGAARALTTFARRRALAALAPCALGRHYLRDKPPFLLRKAVLPRASPGPHFARWLARAPRLRATAFALSWEEAQHARFRRARAAPRWWLSLRALRKPIAPAGLAGYIESRSVVW